MTSTSLLAVPAMQSNRQMRDEMGWAAGLFPDLTENQVLRGNFKRKNTVSGFFSKHFKRWFTTYVWGWTALTLLSFQCTWGCGTLFLNPAKNTLGSQGLEVRSTDADLWTTTISVFFGRVAAVCGPCPNLTDPRPHPASWFGWRLSVHHHQHNLLSCSKQGLGKRCKCVLSSWEQSPGALCLTRDKYSSEHRVKCQSQRISISQLCSIFIQSYTVLSLVRVSVLLPLSSHLHHDSAT